MSIEINPYWFGSRQCTPTVAVQRRKHNNKDLDRIQFTFIIVWIIFSIYNIKAEWNKS